MTDCWFPSGLL